VWPKLLVWCLEKYYLIEELGYDRMWVELTTKDIGCIEFWGNDTYIEGSGWVDQGPTCMFKMLVSLVILHDIVWWVQVHQWCLQVRVVCTDTTLSMSLGIILLQDSVMFHRWRQWWSPTASNSFSLRWELCHIFFCTLYLLSNSCFRLD